MDEMKMLAQNLIITGLGLFAVFTIGIVVVTYVQEFVRSRMRNGKGNQRNGDQTWSAQLLLHMGEMNEKLGHIEHALTNDLPHTLSNLANKIDEQNKKDGREVR